MYDITSPDPADQEDEVEEFVTGRAWKTYHGRWDKPFLQHPMPEIVDDTPSFQPGILIRYYLLCVVLIYYRNGVSVKIAKQ